MRCGKCGSTIIQYELFPRSYRLYVYFCNECDRAFLAHHFDLDLEIYRMQDLEVKRSNGLIFLTGLKAEPRVFDFKVDRGEDVVIVADENTALGELVIGGRYLYAPYSDKALKILCRHLREDNCDISTVTEKVVKIWEALK
jgi:ribosomal protein S27AE